MLTLFLFARAPAACLTFQRVAFLAPTGLPRRAAPSKALRRSFNIVGVVCLPRGGTSTWKNERLLQAVHIKFGGLSIYENQTCTRRLNRAETMK